MGYQPRLLGTAQQAQVEQISPLNSLSSRKSSSAVGAICNKVWRSSGGSSFPASTKAVRTWILCIDTKIKSTTGAWSILLYIEEIIFLDHMMQPAKSSQNAEQQDQRSQ